MLHIPRRLVRLGLLVLLLLVIVLEAISGGVPTDRESLIYKIQNPGLVKLFSHSQAASWTWNEISQALIFHSPVYDHSAPTAYVRKDSHKFYKSLYKQKIPPEPQEMVLTTKDDQKPYIRANGTFVSIVQEGDMEKLLNTVHQVEETWNHNYHYPYVFLSSQNISTEFQHKLREKCSGDVVFDRIPQSLWTVPSTTDARRVKESMKKLAAKGVQLANDIEHRNKMRFKAGYFFNTGIMRHYKYYWNLEAGSDYFCNIDYDIFKFMEQNNLVHGFAISLYDNPHAVETLWPRTLEFVQQHPAYVDNNASFTWLTESLQNPEHTKIANGYSTCYFSSAFEIGDMDFYRSEIYADYFRHLEDSGGFYYERWGDAPVRSIALTLFGDKTKIWWFRDMGVAQDPYHNRPLSDKCSSTKDPAGYFGESEVQHENCLPNWIRYELPEKNKQAYTIQN
ncbi:hypothetical protein KL935_004869 [Ogataea polymorpha]|nr:hypothetical protein KL935_004869 [Ogataea polymorpha]KAG7930317.1 hypothetical protein KL934_005011 [Ogataea polymorpha]